METTIDSVVIEIESNADKSNQNLTSLINTLNSLQNKVNPAIEILNNLNQKLLNLQNTVNNINFDNVKINKLSEPMKKVNNEATTGKAKNIDNYTKKLQGLGKINIAAAGLGLLGISMFSLADALQESTSYITNLHLLYNAMGDNVDKAKEFIDNFSTLLGQDPSKVMKYTSAFYSLTSGFGVANDQAYIMSKNLTQLSYDLAAYWGRDITDTMQAVKSGISGEIEPMRNLGVALDQATLQQTAYTLGINKSINAMTRAEKTQLLYYQMMTKTTNVQKTLANTMLEPAQQISILKQQFTQLARSIGNIFIPILTAVIPYLQALTKYLNEIAQKIAGLLGYKINTEGWGKATNSMVSGIGDIEDGANGATKALKEMLAPFDELNVIDFGKDTGKGLENIATGGDLGIPLYDYDATEGLSANLENIKEKVKQILPFIEAIGAAILTVKNNLGLLEGLGIWLIIDGVRKLIEHILDMVENPSWENFADILRDLSEISLGALFVVGMESPLMPVLAVAAQIFSIISGWIDLIEAFKKFIENPSFENFAEIIRSAISTNIGGNILLWVIDTFFGGWDSLIDQLKNFGESVYNDAIKPIMDFFEPITTWIDENIIKPITGFFDQMWKDITEPLQPLFDEITGTFELIWEDIQIVWNMFAPYFEEIFNAAWVGMQTVWDAVTPYFEMIWNNIQEIFSVVGNVIGGFFSNAWEGVKFVWNTVVNYFTAVWAGIKAVFAAVKGVLTGNFEDAEKAIENVWNKVTGFFQGIWQGIQDAFSHVTNWFRDTFSQAWQAVKNVFSTGGQIFRGIQDGISSVFRTVINSIISGLNTVIAAPFNTLNSIIRTLKQIDIMGLKPFSWLWTISVPRIPTFAEGGFPTQGEAFIARENGPELVGRIGNKSAVANNDQIIAGITQGVSEGVSQAMGGNQQKQPINVYVGNRKVYSGYGEYANTENNMYGTNVVRV